MKKVSSQGSKQFWKTVKFLKKASSQIPTLNNGSTIASSNIDKASLLNEVLSQNFNSSVPPLTVFRQVATSHHLGQNFSKMFEIAFESPSKVRVQH